MEFRGSPIKAIAIDIDGSYATGLDLTDFGYDVLRRVEEAGVFVVVVTGRCESAAVTIAERAGASAPAISCTGAVITQPGSRERVALNPLPDDDLEVALELAEELGLQPYVWDSAGIWMDREGPDTEYLGGCNFLTITPRPKPEQWDQPVKVMASASPEYLDAIGADVVARSTMERCLPGFFEACIPGCSKWDALELVLERLGVSPEETLGFGDSATDVESLSHIGMPIAVENAAAPIQDLAVAHIGHHETDAAARFLAELLELRETERAQ